MFATLFALILATPAPVLSVHTLFPTIETPKELSVQELKNIAQDAAKKYHLNAKKFLKVLECEVKKRDDGTWDYTAQSDHINKRGRENSWGMWQIHLDAHPTITKEQAQDPYWATEWSAKQWAKGNARIWTCWHIVSSA